MLLVCCLAFLYVATAFTVTTNMAFTSPARTSIRRKTVLSMVEDDPSNDLSVMEGKVAPLPDAAESVLSESFVENVVIPDSVVVRGVAEMDSTVFVSAPVVQEAYVAKELVEAALSDPSVVDHIDESVVVTDQVLVDDILLSSETVSAFLAASEEAAAAAEAKLSKEEAEMVPLIRKQPQNDTSGEVVTVKEIPSILPASQVVGEPITAVPTEIETPNVKKILKFAVPAIGVWLCGPLLSLIDTSAVGLFSGTFQQAALNPAVAVTDYSALLIVSLVL